MTPDTKSPSAPTAVGARADLHCHSTASQVSKLGVQRSAGLPECATPPEEVYELAKRRGMDFVTITDHDTIDGAMQIAHLPGAFVSEELTAWFKDEPQAVHVLCLGITPADHEWLQEHAGDVEECAAYLDSNGIACALAHPFYAVAAPLESRHRRRLAELFEVWETRNGSRAHELNMPAAVYVETHGGIPVAGSDDHAGVDIGRTFTQTPPAATPEEFLSHIRAGRTAAEGDQGSAAKWAHAAIAIATRSFGSEAAEAGPPSPETVLGLLERVVGEGSERAGSEASSFGAADARALLGAWLASVGLPSGAELLALMQADDFSHRDLHRRARSVHELRLRRLAAVAGERISAGEAPPAEVLGSLFDACLPVVPYIPATAFLANERRRLVGRGAESDAIRVALVVDAIGAPHGVSHTIERIRELGVRNCEVEVVGTDRGVDRRLPAVAEIGVPFYPGMDVGIPSLPSLVETLTDGRFDLIHLVTPGPAGVAAAMVARIAGIPVLASHHTEFVSYARMRTGSESIAGAIGIALGLFYRDCRRVLSPSTSADHSLADLGVPAERIERWIRGVNIARFNPDRRRRDPSDRAIRVLYAGRLTREKGVDLLAEAFVMARAQEPLVELHLAGSGPEEPELRRKLGDGVHFHGWLGGDDLAEAYASADVFAFCSSTDTYGQVVVEAQASGVPVVAVRAGGPADLIADGSNGLLCNSDPVEIAAKIVRLARSRSQHRRLVRGGIEAARRRSWAVSLEQLGSGYRHALRDGAEAAAGSEQSTRELAALGR